MAAQNSVSLSHVLYVLLCLFIIFVFSDVELPDSPLDHPLFTVPKHCQTLRMNKFSVVVIVPLLTMTNEAEDFEWVLFVRADDEIYFFDIPPTPYTTIKQYTPRVQTDGELFRTLIFDIDDVSIPSFVHLSIRLIHTRHGYHDTSFNTTSIVVRVTDKSLSDESQHISSLYQNAQIRTRQLIEDNARLQQRYNTLSEQYTALTQLQGAGAPLRLWTDAYLTDEFKNAVLSKDLSSILLATDSQFVFKMKNMFTAEFLRFILNEINTAKQLSQTAEIELFAPNSMNRDGFVLKELGLGPLFTTFMNEWMTPITASVYPFYLWCGESLDSFHGFTIRYNEDMDRNLSRHLDQSQITFNLCLQNDDLVGSKILFNGVRDHADSETDDVALSLSQNEALLHVGQQWHSTQNIQKGERINLILWFRSTFCANSVSQYAFGVCPNFMPSEHVHHEL